MLLKKIFTLLIGIIFSGIFLHNAYFILAENDAKIKYDFKIIEKKLNNNEVNKIEKNDFMNLNIEKISYAVELSDDYLFEKTETDRSNGIITIISDTYSCNSRTDDNVYLDCKINLECLEDSECYEENNLLKNIQLIFLGNDSKKLNLGKLFINNHIELNPGEYELNIINKNKEITRQCQNIIPNGFEFKEFNDGVQISGFENSLLCYNINEDCYGILEPGENKMCKITSIIIKI